MNFGYRVRSSEVGLRLCLQVGNLYIDERQIHDVNEMDSHQFRHLLRLLLGLSVTLFMLYIYIYVVYVYE